MDLQLKGPMWTLTEGRRYLGDITGAIKWGDTNFAFVQLRRLRGSPSLAVPVVTANLLVSTVQLGLARPGWGPILFSAEHGRVTVENDGGTLRTGPMGCRPAILP